MNSITFRLPYQPKIQGPYIFQLAQFYGNQASPQHYLMSSCASKRDGYWIVTYLVHKISWNVVLPYEKTRPICPAVSN